MVERIALSPSKHLKPTKIGKKARLRAKKASQREQWQKRDEGKARHLERVRESGVKNHRWQLMMSGKGARITNVPERADRVPPIFVTEPGTKRKLLKAIADGHYISTACALAKVKPDTFRHWIKKGYEGFSKTYVDFYLEVVEADAKAEAKSLKNIKKHARTEWRAEAWFMEHRWSQRWGKKQEISVSGTVQHNHDVTVRDEFAKIVASDEEARDSARSIIEADFSVLPSGGSS